MSGAIRASPGVGVKAGRSRPHTHRDDLSIPDLISRVLPYHGPVRRSDLRSALTGLFRFPDPVNEVSARLVAAGVVLLCLATLVTGSRWLLVALAYGFVARVATGPSLSPLGQVVTRVVTPALSLAPRPVPRPPKRFAQAIGATLSVTALVLALGFGQTTVALVLVAMITFAAVLESVFGYCVGCALFALLMRAGVIPRQVCEACANLELRDRAA
jgi:Domain of unknown function (DUF4395)